METRLTDQQIETWRLFLTAHARLINRFEAELAAQSKIPLHWYDVLIELVEAKDHRLRMSELAERVVLSRSGLTRLVDNLEKDGLITRENDPADRRVSYAALTQAGRQAVRSAWPVYAGLIARHFSQHLSDEQAQALTAAFQSILDHIATDGRA